MRLALVLSLLILVSACGGGSTPPTAPPPQEPPSQPFPRTPADIPVRSLRLGDTTAVDRNSSVERLVYVAPGAQRLAFYFACTSGNIVVRRVPSLGSTTSQVLFESRSVCGSPLLSRWRIDVAQAAGDSLILEVNKVPPTSGIRVVLVPQDTLPEQGPSVVRVGDTLSARLEHPADEDVVEVTPPGPGTYVLYAQSGAPAGRGPLRVSYEAVADQNGRQINSQLKDPDLEFLRSPRVVLRDGTAPARLRIRSDLGATAPGPMEYRVQVRRVDAAPETGSRRVQVGMTVESALEHSADVDVYEAQLSDSSRYVVYLRNRGGPASGRLGLFGPEQLANPTLAIAPRTPRRGDASRFASVRVLRELMPAEGAAEVVGFGVAPGRTESPSETGNPQIDRGSYDFEVVRIEQSPERAPVPLRVDDSVTVESLDVALDLDQYQLAGSFNQAVVYVRSPSGSIGARFSVSDGSGTEVERLPGEPVFAGVRIQRSGINDTLFVLVGSDAQLDSDEIRYYTGPYVLVFREVRSAPEVAAATLPLGTIISESLDFPGDEDHFRYTAADPQRVRVRFAGGFHVRIGGAVLQPSPTAATSDPRDISEDIELAPGAVLQIEVLPPLEGASWRDAGPYRLQVVRQP